MAARYTRVSSSFIPLPETRKEPYPAGINTLQPLFRGIVFFLPSISPLPLRTSRDTKLSAPAASSYVPSTDTEVMEKNRQSVSSVLTAPSVEWIMLQKGISFLVRSAEQLKALDDVLCYLGESDVARVYFEEELFCNEKNVALIDKVKAITGISVYAACSFIRRKGDDISRMTVYIDSGLIDGVLVRNLEDLAVFSEIEGLTVITDFGLYSWNGYSAAELGKYASGCTLPLELSKAECRDLLKISDVHVEKSVYGRAPLMISANCVRKTLKSCTKKSGFETIIDRKGISFPVYADCYHCLNVIYNSVPLILKNEQGICNRIELTTENRDECAELIRLYLSGKTPQGAHTSGWAERPVM